VIACTIVLPSVKPLLRAGTNRLNRPMAPSVGRRQWYRASRRTVDDLETPESIHASSIRRDDSPER
jgi:hypothetical protein